MRIHQLLSFLAFLTLLCTCGPAPEKNAEGKADYSVAKWKNLRLDFTGPATSETSPINPFTDYRLDVTFTNGDRTLTVPGYYAADGNAAETSADSGNVWRVNFRPDREGTWTWKADFKKGFGVASDENATGVSGKVTNATGTIAVGPPAAGETGRLVRTHPRYLQWAETGKYFLKGGTDSPENLLGYYDFDGTYRHNNKFRDGEAKTEGLHKYDPHASDFTDGPTWQNGKGKNLMGAISYLAGKGVNSIYFLTNNIGGDGKDVWPWIDHETLNRYDVSKLDQWERVFTHADDLGMMLHFVLQETENETMLDGGDAGPLRRLYFRELVARFGHHRAVTWNLGEENGPNNWSDTHQTTAQQEAGLVALSALDAYDNYTVLHTHPGEEAFAKIYEPLLGNEYLDGLALQMGNPFEAHVVTKKWLDLSEKAGEPWLMTIDETGPWYRGLDPDTGYAVNNGASNNQDSLRALTLWGNLMAGGGGVEWYFGAKNPNNDLNAEDWRSRDNAWNWTAAVIDFFQQNVPFHEMENHDELITDGEAFCLSTSGSYLVYLPFGKPATIDLSGETERMVLTWYKGASGEQSGENVVVQPSEKIKLSPPGPGDWAATLTAE